MKNFVVKYGGFVINLAAIITIIGLIISTINVMINQGFIASMTFLWAGLVSFVFVYFLIYLVMSINDHLEDISHNNDRY